MIFSSLQKSSIMSNTTLFNSPCFMLKVDVALIQVLGRRLPHHQQHGQNSLWFSDDRAYPLHVDSDEANCLLFYLDRNRQA